MSWKESMQEWGGGDFTFLSTDGETLTFIVVADPVMLKSKYKGKDQDRIGVPAVTDEGFQLLITGKRLARKIGKREEEFKKHAFIATRHGEEGDVNSTYSLATIPEKECFARLVKIAKSVMEETTIADAVDAVRQVMDN